MMVVGFCGGYLGGFRGMMGLTLVLWLGVVAVVEFVVVVAASEEGRSVRAVAGGVELGARGEGVVWELSDDDPCEGVCRGLDLSCVVAGNGRGFCVGCTGLLKPKGTGTASFVECCNYSSEKQRCSTALKTSRVGICKRSEDLFVRSPELTRASVRRDSGYACSKVRDFFDNGLACRLERSRAGVLKCKDREGIVQKPCDEGFAQVGPAIDGEQVGDEAGEGLAISANGSRVAIGARRNENVDADGNRLYGHVRVFEMRESTRWVQLGEDIDSQTLFDSFGSSVAMSADGSRVAIGARFNDGNADDAGRVLVFEFKGSRGWVQLGQDIDGESRRSYAGSSIAMSADGNRVVVGASGNSDAGPNTGQVRTFELRENQRWVQLGQGIHGVTPYDNIAQKEQLAISADGNRVAIGSKFHDNNGENSGHVRVFELRSNEVWVQIGQSLDGRAAEDFSGSSVAITDDGNRVAIGTPIDGRGGSNEGYVRVFEFKEREQQWVQLGQDIDAMGGELGLGNSVAISGDGSRVVGVTYVPSENGEFLSYGQVFELQSSGEWAQIGPNIDREDTSFSFLNAVISADGSRVAMGAASYVGLSSVWSGQVRVYEFTSRCR